VSFTPVSDDGARTKAGKAPFDHATDELLIHSVERKSSDLHLTAGLPPMIRVDGTLRPLDQYAVLDPMDTQTMLYQILSDRQITRFESDHELDFSYGVRGVGRFRVNAYIQRGAIGIAFRVIPSKIPTLEDLGMPAATLRRMCTRGSGLILVTGPTGAGKSTTLASMVDVVNSTRRCHIMTIEDPIEYLHMHKQSMVNQRELGSDTFAFAAALRAVLREDPDVILVGEMRDLETIQAALTVAETGHLVFATLHTRSAPQSIDRIIDVFPPHQQEQIRIQLASTLEAVVSQQLLPRYGTPGRVPAYEIMICNSAVRNLIREGKTRQIYSVIETSAQEGMVLMDVTLAELQARGAVSYDDAMHHALDPDYFKRLSRRN